MAGVPDLNRWPKESMSIEALVQAGISAPLSEEGVAEACARLSVSRPDLFDAYAREVADGFKKGRYAWSACDSAMNALFSFAYAVSLSSLPDFAFRVYTAFDEGEYRDGGELVTRELLAGIE
jgi:hypothetical protein